MSSYFTFEELQLLKGAEGKILTQVIYHHWINKTKPGESFEILEKLELRFQGITLIIGVPEEAEDQLVLDQNFDAEKHKLLLLHEFQGKIDTRAEDKSTDVLWSDAVGKKLQALRLVDEGENVYSNSAILLDFKDQQLEIRPGIDGVMVDIYED